MHSLVHPLQSSTPESAPHLTSHHFAGPNLEGRKIYIQAALHADEIPAMLVAVKLKERLTVLEAEGMLRAEVVLVPVANPIGLNQVVLGNLIGRFELGTGHNFNRSCPMLHTEICSAVEGKLTQDAKKNLQLLRSAWKTALQSLQPKTPIASLHRALMLMSHDADIVLDLHCSREASMHLYTGEAIWAEVEPLARYLGCNANLLAIDSGAQSFDEAHSTTWWHLQQRFGATYPVPHGSIAVTIEHRGQRNVTDALADQDADAIVAYLQHVGAIAGTAPEMPELLGPATPLAGSEQLLAPQAGIVVYRAKVGEHVVAGQLLIDIVEPVSGKRWPVSSRDAGILYMGRDVRYVRQGDPLGRVSGRTSLRSGNLLGP